MIASASHRISPAVVLLMFSVISFACSYGPRRDCERLSAGAIFIGHVLETTPKQHMFGNQPYSGYSQRIAVEKVLKGDIGHELSINNSGSNCGDCLQSLPIGKRFLVYASKDENGEWWAGAPDATELKDNDAASAAAVEAVRTEITKGKGSLFGLVSFGTPSHYQNLGRRVEGFTSQAVSGMTIRAKSAKETFTTQTVKDGRYEFVDLPNGTYTVVPELRPDQTFDQHFLTERTVKPVADGSCSKVDFSLFPATRLKGRVLLPARQQFALIPESDSVVLGPIAAVPIELTQTNEHSGVTTYADENGNFDIWPMAPGDYYVGININASPTPETPFTPTYYPGVTEKPKAHIVHVGEGETKYIEFPEPHLAQERTVYVEAVGLDGKPLPQVSVQQEDLEHRGNAIYSMVDVDLDANGAGQMIVYAGINYHLHATYYSTVSGKNSCAEAVTVPAGSESVKVRFVMDRLEGPDPRFSDGIAYRPCSMEIVDDPHTLATAPAEQ